jgi:type II secretion system-associated lipoprotein
LKRIIAAIAASLLLVPACDVFVPGKDLSTLREKENRIYVLKNDLEIDGKKLKKGEDVRIKITTGSAWIKVHAYPARTDALKAEYLLLLFVFDDEFEKNKYNAGYFNERLGALVADKGAAPVTKKK